MRTSDTMRLHLRRGQRPSRASYRDRSVQRVSITAILVNERISVEVEAHYGGC